MLFDARCEVCQLSNKWQCLGAAVRMSFIRDVRMAEKVAQHLAALAPSVGMTLFQ
jgi:hypothetical protein